MAAVDGTPEVLPQPLSDLARYGLLGLLLAVALYALYRRDADLKQCNSDRLSDVRTLTAVVSANNEAMAAATAAQTERNRVTERSALAIEQMTQQVTAMTKAIDNLVSRWDQAERTLESNVRGRG
jgi:hypothetical protein